MLSYSYLYPKSEKEAGCGAGYNRIKVEKNTLGRKKGEELQLERGMKRKEEKQREKMTRGRGGREGGEGKKMKIKSIKKGGGKTDEV